MVANRSVWRGVSPRLIPRNSDHTDGRTRPKNTNLLGEKRRVAANGSTKEEVEAALDQAVAALEPRGRWSQVRQTITTKDARVGGSRTVELTSMKPPLEPRPSRPWPEVKAEYEAASYKTFKGATNTKDSPLPASGSWPSTRTSSRSTRNTRTPRRSGRRSYWTSSICSITSTALRTTFSPHRQLLVILPPWAAVEFGPCSSERRLGWRLLDPHDAVALVAVVESITNLKGRVPASHSDTPVAERDQIPNLLSIPRLATSWRRTGPESLPSSAAKNFFDPCKKISLNR